MKKTTRLRELLEEEEAIMAPAVYDCLSAKIAEKVGFKALFVSGLCLNAAVKGLPDIGAETRTDTVNLARNISGSIETPLIVDAADGYGGPVGIYNTVRELEQAGVAGCSIEDQRFPPRCPNFGPPEVIPLNEFVLKIEIALEARTDKDFVIIARTDSAARLGIEEAIERGLACREAGADIVLPAAGGPRDKKALRQFVEAVKAPVMIPPAYHLGLALKDYQEIGVKVISGLEVLLSAAKAIEKVLQELYKTGTVKDKDCHSIAITRLGERLEWDRWFALERRFHRANK